MKVAVLTMRFLTELLLLAVLAAWGAWVGDSLAADVALGIAAPLAAAAVWGIWIAPRSRRRLADPARLALEAVLFALGALALAHFGSWSGAISFAIGTIMLAWAVRLVGEELATR
ncbi:MAG TPA: DUF2568 domain-containing protein [Thermoleophilaceae bacterium]|jgi:hypothetical protein